MITGVHAIIFNQDADGVRAFFRDTLGFSSVDAGGGWLIFALPPAELGIHPTDEAGHHEFYLMCDDMEKTLADLTARGVTISHSPSDQGWGLLASIQLPGGSDLSIYQPRHPTAYDLEG